MLIQEALNLLTPQITALGWVEYFGGVVQRVSIPSSDEQGNTTYKHVPISCSVSQADCNKNQRYKDLTPDSSKKSILYWEVQQGLQDVGANRGLSNQRKMIGRARLVGWLNINKLGVNNCNTAAQAMRSLLPILYSQFKGIALPTVFQNTTINFEFAGEAVKDSDIFGAYDYGANKDGFLLYPYDFFAMNVQVEAIVSLCDYTFATGAPVQCKDFSQL